MSDRRWHLRSRAVNEVVHAPDQFDAWDTLRDRPAEDFGLVVTAEPDESGDPITVRTSALMFSWGREVDAAAFVVIAVESGLPNTTLEDLRFGRPKGRPTP